MKSSWQKGNHYLNIIPNTQTISIGYTTSIPHEGGGTTWSFREVLASHRKQTTIRNDYGQEALDELLEAIQSLM